MRRIFILCLTTLTSLLLLVSCEEEEIESITVETIDATLAWSGDYALDGCGYILQVGEAEYKPSNEKDISSSYKTSPPTRVEAKIINNKTVKACSTGEEMNNVEVVSLVKM